MKKIESVMVTGSTGQVQADTYDRWTKKIEGVEFEFALVADATPGQGFIRKLRICEVSTGFDTGTLILHPVHRVQITEAALTSLSARQIKQTARASLHNHLNRVGHVNFVQAMVNAQITLTKMAEPEEYEATKEPEPDFEKGRAWLKRKNGELDLRDTNGMEGLGKLIGVIN